MVPARLSALRCLSKTHSPSRLWRRLVGGCSAAGLPLLGLACAQIESIAQSPAPAVVRAAPAEFPDVYPAKTAKPEPAKVLAINLDTVLRLAEEQNAKIAGA